MIVVAVLVLPVVLAQVAATVTERAVLLHVQVAQPIISIKSTGKL
jgi:hypothetical protein